MTRLTEGIEELDRIDRIGRIFLLERNRFKAFFRGDFEIKIDSFIFISNGPLN